MSDVQVVMSATSTTTSSSPTSKTGVEAHASFSKKRYLDLAHQVQKKSIIWPYLNHLGFTFREVLDPSS